jgi:hypothetical protein
LVEVFLRLRLPTTCVHDPDFLTSILAACSPVEEAIRFPSPELSNRISTSLSIPNGRVPTVRGLRIERSFRTTDGLQGCILSYLSLGNRRIEACLLKPEGVKHPLPGVLALHCHGNIKRWGWQKIADDDRPVPPELLLYRERGYGGRAYPNELAKQGFVVLVPDCFLWGSRTLASSEKPQYHHEAGELLAVHPRFSSKIPPECAGSDLLHEIATDNCFEPEVEKALEIRGTSIAGVVNFDDRTSAQVLRSLVDVDQQFPLTAIGLSGGGNRVGMLMAMEPSVHVGVIAGMMCTYKDLLNSRNWWKHTNMLYPPNREDCRYGEWPDLVASQAHSKWLFCL